MFTLRQRAVRGLSSALSAPASRLLSGAAPRKPAAAAGKKGKFANFEAESVTPAVAAAAVAAPAASPAKPSFNRRRLDDVMPTIAPLGGSGAAAGSAAAAGAGSVSIESAFEEIAPGVRVKKEDIIPWGGDVEGNADPASQYKYRWIQSIDRSGLIPSASLPDPNAAPANALAHKSPATPLVDELKAHILYRGPLSVAEYMQFCLGHPQHGYYMHREAIGKGADFVTSPEISPIFGELLGVWAVSTWIKLGRPPRVNLVELGPGRGTLMRDMLSAAQRFPDFHRALSVHLVENSYSMRRQQMLTLGVELDAAVLDDAAEPYRSALPLRSVMGMPSAFEDPTALRDDFLARAMIDVQRAVEERVERETAAAAAEGRPVPDFTTAEFRAEVDAMRAAAARDAKRAARVEYEARVKAMDAIHGPLMSSQSITGAGTGAGVSPATVSAADANGTESTDAVAAVTAVDTEGDMRVGARSRRPQPAAEVLEEHRDVLDRWAAERAPTVDDIPAELRVFTKSRVFGTRAAADAAPTVTKTGLNANAAPADLLARDRAGAATTQQMAVHWHWNVGTLPTDVPSIFFGHEFFDALPVHQFQYTARGWREVLVDVDEGAGPHHFKYVLAPMETPASKTLLAPISDLDESAAAVQARAAAAAAAAEAELAEREAGISADGFVSTLPTARRSAAAAAATAKARAAADAARAEAAKTPLPALTAAEEALLIRPAADAVFTPGAFNPAEAILGATQLEQHAQYWQAKSAQAGRGRSATGAAAVSATGATGGKAEALHRVADVRDGGIARAAAELHGDMAAAERSGKLDHTTPLTAHAGRAAAATAAAAAARSGPQIGDTYEVSPVAMLWMEQITLRLMRSGGAGLFIDYGDNETGFETDQARRAWSPAAEDSAAAAAATGSVKRPFSLQGIKAHAHADVLSEPGLVDLSAHVNFGALSVVTRRVVNQVRHLLRCPPESEDFKRAASMLGLAPTAVTADTTLRRVDAFPAITQSALLQQLGVEKRFEVLVKNCGSEEEAEALFQSVNRLVDPAQMGELFKCMAVGQAGMQPPVGWNKDEQ